MLHPQRQWTVFLTISVFRITSLLEWTVTKFKFVQIYCSRNCSELFNACFPDDFLMHSNVEYQCSSPCKYMNGSFIFSHMQSIWTMFGTNNNSDKVSNWEYMESQRRMQGCQPLRYYFVFCWKNFRILSNFSVSLNLFLTRLKTQLPIYSGGTHPFPVETLVDTSGTTGTGSEAR